HGRRLRWSRNHPWSAHLWCRQIALTSILGPAGHLPTRPCVALLADLAPELQGVPTALGPAPSQVRRIGVEPTRSLRILPFRRGIGEEVAAHHRARDAQVTRDPQDRPTIGGPTVDLGMDLCGTETQGRAPRLFGRRSTAWPGLIGVHLYLAQVLTVTVKQALGYLPDILQHVPAIDHLLSCRRAHRRASRILRGTVAHDDLHTRVLLQPRRERPRRTILEQVDRPSGLEVDQDRAIATAPSPRPIIDTEHARHAHRVVVTSQQPEQGISADGRADGPCQTRPRLTSERDANSMQHALQAYRRAAIPRRRPGHLLDERPTRTGRCPAHEAAHRQLHAHRAPTGREVAQRPDVPAMHPT